MRHKHSMTWNMARNTEKVGKRERHTVGPALCVENRKSWKMRNTHCRTWNMARNTEKTWKTRNEHCRIWNMVRKMNIMENERQTL